MSWRGSLGLWQKNEVVDVVIKKTWSSRGLNSEQTSSLTQQYLVLGTKCVWLRSEGAVSCWTSTARLVCEIGLSDRVVPAIAVKSLLPHGSLSFDKVTDLQAFPKKQTQSTLNISFGICFSWTLKLERMCLFLVFVFFCMLKVWKKNQGKKNAYSLGSSSKRSATLNGFHCCSTWDVGC